MPGNNHPWYSILNIDDIDSPALVVYKNRVEENIQRLIRMVSSVEALRPHVKTNKMPEVCRMMMQAGIHKFKCATIAEAEMLAQITAPDVLLAYQPVGPKAKRFVELVRQYPATHFSCLVDNMVSAAYLSALAVAAGKTIDIFIDLNTGMNRTGIIPGQAALLAEALFTLDNIYFAGWHAYDGHIRDTDPAKRQQRSDTAFEKIIILEETLAAIIKRPLKIVVGGSPTSPTHAKRENVECSPGTFVFWDWGYKHQVPDEPFEYAALVITRIISVVDQHTVCADLGHKSVAAENPLPRVHFLNAPDAAPIGQSEEHLVLKVPDAAAFKVGDVLYGVPVHICPTVALYEKAAVVEQHRATAEWRITARDRTISI